MNVEALRNSSIQFSNSSQFRLSFVHNGFDYFQVDFSIYFGDHCRGGKESLGHEDIDALAVCFSFPVSKDG